MMLVEDGRLALDAEVRTWLPELAEPTVLRHWSGPLDDVVPAERPITVAGSADLPRRARLPRDFSVPVVGVLLDRCTRARPTRSGVPAPGRVAGRAGHRPAAAPAGDRAGPTTPAATSSACCIARAAGRPLPRRAGRAGLRAAGHVRHRVLRCPAGPAAGWPAYYAADAETGGLRPCSTAPRTGSGPTRRRSRPGRAAWSRRWTTGSGSPGCCSTTGWSATAGCSPASPSTG